MLRDKDQIVKGSDDSEDEKYNEAEDEDYNPQQAAIDEDISSSEDEGITTGKKRKANAEEKLDSGDEATIKERRSKKRRKVEDEGSEGDGVMIKTRSQREAEKQERRTRKKITGGIVTIDVDKLWQDLNSLPVGEPATNEVAFHETTAAPPEEHITIKRRIKFAGQITEVEEEVLRNSDEAQKYLAEQEAEKVDEPEVTNGIQRPLRRYSAFEPNPLGNVKGIPPDKLRRRAPSRMDIAMAEKRAEDERRKKAEKLGVMQKTALDWKGFVIEQGLGEELNDYGKSKQGFLAREQFLDNVHGAKEMARRAARLKV